MADRAWRVLVVDDEPPIRAELSYLLQQDVRIGAIEEAGGAAEAVAKILENHPDVLFLDIQMPGTNGIKLADTLRSLKTPPVVVFVTAFSEYAAEAFGLNAVDYLLKPVETGRLEQALTKIEQALAARKPAPGAAQVRRVAVERNGQRSFIPIADVSYIEAKADYATAHTSSGAYLVGESISVLEERFEADGFLRVHRSFLVNIDDVHDIEVNKPSGLIQLTLESTGAVVPVSRRRAGIVKRRLGLA